MRAVEGDRIIDVQASTGRPDDHVVIERAEHGRVEGTVRLYARGRGGATRATRRRGRSCSISGTGRDMNGGAAVNPRRARASFVTSGWYPDGRPAFIRIASAHCLLCVLCPMPDLSPGDRPITAAQRAQLLNLNSEMRVVAEQGLNQASKMRKLFEQIGIGYDADIQNAQEFIFLITHDMSLLVDGILRQNSILEKNFYSRTTVLNVYEATLSLKSLLSSGFRDQMVAALDLDDDAEVRSVHSQACSLFEKCRSEFGDVRNGMIGHWDKNSQNRLDLIDKTEEKEVFDLAVEAAKMTRDLTRLFLPYTLKQRFDLESRYGAQAEENA